MSDLYLQWDKERQESVEAWQRIDKLIKEMEVQNRQLAQSRNFWKDKYYIAEMKLVKGGK